jgi:hypothetical protein
MWCSTLVAGSYPDTFLVRLQYLACILSGLYLPHAYKRTTNAWQLIYLAAWIHCDCEMDPCSNHMQGWERQQSYARMGKAA